MDATPRRIGVFVMAARSRDRVTIDLCGIGDAARAVALTRGATLALFARQSLIAALPGDAASMLPRAEPSFDPGGTIKLSVRLSAADSASLAALATLRQRMLNLDADIAPHLQVAAALLARIH